MGIFSRRESYKVACPHCRAKLKIERAEVARGRFRCPSCGRGNPIPHDVQAAFGLRRAKEREKQQAREQMKREREQARQEQQAAQGSGQEHAGPESTSAVVAARMPEQEPGNGEPESNGEWTYLNGEPVRIPDGPPTPPGNSPNQHESKGWMLLTVSGAVVLLILIAWGFGLQDPLRKADRGGDENVHPSPSVQPELGIRYPDADTVVKSSPSYHRLLWLYEKPISPEDAKAAVDHYADRLTSDLAAEGGLNPLSKVELYVYTDPEMAELGEKRDCPIGVYYLRFMLEKDPEVELVEWANPTANLHARIRDAAGYAFWANDGRFEEGTLYIEWADDSITEMRRGVVIMMMVEGEFRGMHFVQMQALPEVERVHFTCEVKNGPTVTFVVPRENFLKACMHGQRYSQRNERIWAMEDLAYDQHYSGELTKSEFEAALKAAEMARHQFMDALWEDAKMFLEDYRVK